MLVGRRKGRRSLETSERLVIVDTRTMSTLLLVVWLFVASSCTANTITAKLRLMDCPFRDSDPCDCSYASEHNYTSVTCKQVSNKQVFVNMLNKLNSLQDHRTKPNYKDSVHYLYLYSSSVSSLSPNVFEEFRAKGLTIKDTAFVDQRTSVGVVFQALRTTLDQLHLSNCYLTSKNFLNLDFLPLLRRIIVTKNNIPLLSAALFSKPSENLREVYLHDNKIEKLEPYAFTNARKLKILLLNNNRIESWDRSYLPNPAEELRELHLRNNKLESLPSLMFLNVPRLTLLDLSENNIQQLPETIWQPVWKQLTDIYLKGNPIQCSCELQWLAFQEKEMPRIVRHGRLLYATCTTPRHVYGKSLDELTTSDTICSPS